jgi:tetratricopeptide (TPR) repeat protein
VSSVTIILQNSTSGAGRLFKVPVFLNERSSDMADAGLFDLKKIPMWVSILSTLVTLGMTVVNDTTKNNIDQAQQEIAQKKAEVELRLQQQLNDLEVSKEKTTRYEFVHQLVSDLTKEGNSNRMLTINLIQLALSPDEADRLFKGFQQSNDEMIRKIGREGIAISSGVAAESENKAFEHLAEGNVDDAIREFNQANNSVPSYHNSYRISQLLRREQGRMTDPEERKKIFGIIIKEYSAGIPQKNIEKLRKAAER